MTIFLDVAVVQIQSWLARTPHLRGRRGASRMIREATMAEAVDKMLTKFTTRRDATPPTGTSTASSRWRSSATTPWTKSSDT